MSRASTGNRDSIEHYLPLVDIVSVPRLFLLVSRWHSGAIKLDPSLCVRTTVLRARLASKAVADGDGDGHEVSTIPNPQPHVRSAQLRLNWLIAGACDDYLKV